MSFIRRRAAAIALALTLLQGIVLAASGVVCASTALAGASDDCCAKGAHPPGMCPLRHQPHGKSAGDSTTCRLSCAASVAGPVVLMAGVTLAPPATLASPPLVRMPFFRLVVSPLESVPVSLTPPPRS